MLTGYQHLDDADDPETLERAALWLAKHVGVNILRGKELKLVALWDGHVIGAFWDEVSGDTYSFDIVVHPRAQGNKIGQRLFDFGVANAQEMADAGITTELDAINPLIIPMAKKAGFRVTGQEGGHTFLTLEPT